MKRGLRAINPLIGILDKDMNEMVLGDTVILLDRFVGTVVFECGAYGISFDTKNTLDWDYIESQIKPITGCDNKPAFCRDDNFVTLWELLWNFNCEEDACTVVKVDLAARRERAKLFRELDTAENREAVNASHKILCDSTWKSCISDWLHDKAEPEPGAKTTD